MEEKHISMRSTKQKHIEERRQREAYERKKQAFDAERKRYSGDNSSGSKRKERKKRSKKKIALIVICVILAVVLLALGGLYMLFRHYYGLMNYQPIDENEVVFGSIEEEEEGEGPDSDPEAIQDMEDQLRENMEAGKMEIPYDSDVYNVLLFGTDSRADDARGRSDSMILVSINRKEKRITMTSLMRDIYVTIPGVENNRLNAAYAFGGTPLMLETIEANLGVHIDHYVQVNFFAFMSVIDYLGGIDLEISADEIEIMNNYIKELNQITGDASGADMLSASDAGMSHLNGKQTLAYCRIRYLAGGEYERTRRQRDVLTYIFQEAKSCSLTELNGLLQTLLPELTTNIPQGEMLSLVLDAPTLLGYELESWRIPVEGTYEDMRIDGKAVIGIDFEANRDALYDIIYGER